MIELTACILDPGRIAEMRADLGEEIARKLFCMFLELREVRIQAMRAALAEADAAALSLATHAFRGNAANVGAATLRELCRQLEELADRGALDRAGDLLDEIEAEARLASQEIERLCLGLWPGWPSPDTLPSSA